MSSSDTLPSLQGCRIALTVASDDPTSPASPLTEREADILYYPVAQTLPPDSYDELDAALKQCNDGEIDWLLFTTPYAVEAVAERMDSLGIAESQLSEVKIATYGARTNQSLMAIFPTWQVSHSTQQSHQEIVTALELGNNPSVVVPVAQRTRTDWKQLLTAAGATVLQPPAYRLILGRGGDDLPGALWGGLVDAVVFLTENSVRHFVIRLRIEGGSLDMLGDVVIACLDPQTAVAARAYDLTVQIIPSVHTVDALAEALAHFFSDARVELPHA